MNGSVNLRVFLTQITRLGITTISQRGFTLLTVGKEINPGKLRAIASQPVGRQVCLTSTQSSASSPNHGPEQDPGKLIYTGPNNGTVKLVKYFSLSTSGLGILAQPYLLSQMIANGAMVKMVVMGFTGFFVIGTPFLLHFISKRYVTHLYYNRDTNTFTAVRLNFFAREKKVSFTPEEIRDSVPSPLSNFQVRDHAFLLDTDRIREDFPEVYVKFMKYDKPIDLSKYLKTEVPREGDAKLEAPSMMKTDATEAQQQDKSKA